MKRFAVGDKVKRVSSGLIGMPIGSIWTVDYVDEDVGITVEGRLQVLFPGNFEHVSEEEVNKSIFGSEFG